MKKIDLGQIVGILANIGVITGIVFLAIEINQNNDLLRADARRDQLEARAITLRLMLDSPELMNVAYKDDAGEQLTPREEFAARIMEFQRLLNWEWQYGEYAAGSLREDELPMETWRSVARNVPRLREVWRDSTSTRDPEFVDFIERNVFAVLE